MKRSARFKSKKKAISKRNRLKKKIRNRLPKWQWNPANGKYEMSEVKNGITYGILLDQIQWLSMMDKCNNRFERKKWLLQNNLNPKQIKKYAKSKKLAK